MRVTRDRREWLARLIDGLGLCRLPASLVAAAAIGLAACSGGSSTPQVASLGNSSGDGGGSPAATGSSAATQGNPTQLLNEWAACMRSHGDPGQPDPTIDANKVIHVIFGPDAPKDPARLGRSSGCDQYMNAASKELGPGLSQEQPDQATLDKFSACVRAHGIADFPDLTAGSGIQLNANGGDLSPNNPALENAMKVCARKYDVPGIPGGTPPAGSVSLGSLPNG
jgi:hypothetical protein